MTTPTVQTIYADIPATWYKPFKLYSQMNKNYEDTMLKYMLNYPQNFLSDPNYLDRLKNNNPAVNTSIVNLCKKDNKLIDDNNSCVKYVKDTMNAVIKNTTFDITKNSNANCESQALLGKCITDSANMFSNCPKSCNDDKKIPLLIELFTERLKLCLSLLETSNYTNEYAINYILNELIPFIRKTNGNDSNKIFNHLSTLNVVNQKLIDFAENDNNIEFTNNYIKQIYNELKDMPVIATSMKKIIVKRCKLKNKDNINRFTIEDQCSNYIKTDNDLNQTILDYCNIDDNMKNDYCTKLDNSIIQGKKDNKLVVNSELATNMNNSKIKYVKNKLKSTNYTDTYSTNYLNNEYKTLVDNLTTNVNDRNTKYLDLVDTDAIKFCEDNYLEYENETKPFCKQTYTTYKDIPDINNSANKITSNNCVYNNKFVSDPKCIEFANDNRNYIKFIEPTNKYCSIDDNITNDFCQKYYKNTENKLNDLIIKSNAVTKPESFNNNENDNDNDKILHNVELESFTDNSSHTIIIWILFIVLFAYLVIILTNKYKVNKVKNIINKFSN